MTRGGKTLAWSVRQRGERAHGARQKEKERLRSVTNHALINASTAGYLTVWSFETNPVGGESKMPRPLLFRRFFFLISSSWCRWVFAFFLSHQEINKHSYWFYNFLKKSIISTNVQIRKNKTLKSDHDGIWKGRKRYRKQTISILFPRWWTELWAVDRNYIKLKKNLREGNKQTNKQKTIMKKAARIH